MKRFTAFGVLAAATHMMTSPAVAGVGAYVGEIDLFAGSFCPKDYAEADGRLLSIDTNVALFALLGVTFGGDGKTNFALPDLRGRVPIGLGVGPDQRQIRAGQEVGAPHVNLSLSQLPAHTHRVSTTAKSTLNVTSAAANATVPDGKALGTTAAGQLAYADGDTLDRSMADNVVTTSVDTQISPSGSGAAVPTYQPSVGIRFCVRIQGNFPDRD
ncbi:MAG: tail fiber protein [Thalassovita sp.]